jgi:DNA-binding transcriptional LysR family regulator
MNAKQFQYVLVLTREGSFSKAADALGISQPSLSQYVKKIERSIGQTLFDRTNGEVRLTEAGRLYIEAGQKILDIEHQLENAFADLAACKTGSLIVGTAPYRAASMLPAVASAFRARYPGMHLVVREGTTAELAEGMAHGEYDLALTLLPLDPRLFQYEKVVEEELILAVPSSFPPFPSTEGKDRKYPAVDAKVLDGQAMVMLTDTQFMQKQLEHLLLDYRLKVSVAAVVKSLEAQIEMVRAGIGMALMPSGIERFCRDASVRFYSFRDPLPKRELVVMWRKDRKLSSVAEELKEVIRGIQW